MVDKNYFEEYFERVKEEYKNQVASKELLDRDIEVYKEFLEFTESFDDETLNRVKNCEDFLKCRKLILNGYLKRKDLPFSQERIIKEEELQEIFEKEEKEKSESLEKLKTLLKDLKILDLVEIDTHMSKEEIDYLISSLSSSFVFKIRRLLELFFSLERKIKRDKISKPYFDTFYPKSVSKDDNFIIPSNKIEYMIPKEYALLSDEELEVLFLIKYFEHNLLTFNIQELQNSSFVEVKRKKKKIFPLVLVINVKKVSLEEEIAIKAVVIYLLKKVELVYAIYNDNLMIKKDKIDVRDFVKFLTSILGDANNINVAVKLAKEKEAKLLVISDRNIDVDYEDKYLLVIGYDFFEREDKYKEEWNFNLNNLSFLLKSLIETF